MGENNTKWNIHKKALLDALVKCMGNVSEACKMAGIKSRTTYYRYMEDADFKAAVEEIEESNLDFAEGQLKKLMRGIEIPDTEYFMYKGEIIQVPVIKKYAPDKAAIIFYLKTKAKRRGYIETVEHLNKNQSLDPFEGMTEEEIDAKLAELEEKESTKAEDPEQEPRDYYNEEEV
jgi:hypothetical protein